MPSFIPHKTSPPLPLRAGALGRSFAVSAARQRAKRATSTGHKGADLNSNHHQRPICHVRGYEIRGFVGGAEVDSPLLHAHVLYSPYASHVEDDAVLSVHRGIVPPISPTDSAPATGSADPNGIQARDEGIATNKGASSLLIQGRYALVSGPNAGTRHTSHCAFPPDESASAEVLNVKLQ